jgi:thymidylate kinase
LSSIEIAYSASIADWPDDAKLLTVDATASVDVVAELIWNAVTQLFGLAEL